MGDCTERGIVGSCFVECWAAIIWEEWNLLYGRNMSGLGLVCFEGFIGGE